MSSNATTDRGRVQLATTFQPDEVRAFLTLIGGLRMGDRGRVILNSPALLRLERKFVRMHEKARAER